MHPLKLLVYAALDVPIVSTDIDNLGEFRDLVRIGRTPCEFCEAVARSLTDGSSKIDEKSARRLLSLNSWERRVADIFSIIDRNMIPRKHP